jgi:hypothetical protein
VTARLAEIQENLKVIHHKIDVYRGRLAAGDADQLWAPNRLAGAELSNRQSRPAGDRRATGQRRSRDVLSISSAAVRNP